MSNADDRRHEGGHITPPNADFDSIPVWASDGYTIRRTAPVTVGEQIDRLIDRLICVVCGHTWGFDAHCYVCRKARRVTIGQEEE